MKFADAHRNIEKFGIHLLKTIKPVKNLTVGVKGLAKKGYLGRQKSVFKGVVLKVHSLREEGCLSAFPQGIVFIMKRT